MNSVWVTKQWKQPTTYAARWVRMYSPSVRRSICSPALRNSSLQFDDLPRSGRPLGLNVDLLSQLIEKDPRLPLWCLAEQLECSYTAVEKHLNELGKTSRCEIWTPHELSAHQLKYRVVVCMNLMTPRRNY